MTSSPDEIIAAIALTRINGIGSITAHSLMEHAESARQLFEAGSALPDIIPDVQPRLIKLLADRNEALRSAEEEYRIAQSKGVRCITFHDDEFPARLRECVDAPVVLFYCGNAPLNAERCISIVGTRRCSAHGQNVCNTIVSDLASMYPDLLVVSGLAYGVDVCAHKAALAAKLNTVGVMAHGLDRIYPSEHRNVAMQMCKQGGVITEFPMFTTPERQNFVRRNRIIAGMSAATIIIESAVKGGSLITAEMALNYGRDVFAVPGRITDKASEGCNKLIHRNGALLITSAEDIAKALNWEVPNEKQKPVQQNIFEDLSEEQQVVIKVLRDHNADVQINTLAVQTDMPVYKLTPILFELELAKIVQPLCGGMYRLLH